MSDLLLRRRRAFMKSAVSSDAVLLHQYSWENRIMGDSDDYVGWYDEVGNYDISTLNGDTSWVKGVTSDTDEARALWGINPGNDFTFKLRGYQRTNQYYQNVLQINLSGTRYQNGFSLGRDTNDRFYGIRHYARSGTGTKNAAPLRLSYYDGETGGTDTNSYSENTFAPVNGDPQDVVIRFDSMSGIITAHVDGVLFNVIEYPAERKEFVHIDGISMRAAVLTSASPYWSFSKIQIYKGIAN